MAHILCLIFCPPACRLRENTSICFKRSRTLFVWPIGIWTVECTASRLYHSVHTGCLSWCKSSGNGVHDYGVYDGAWCGILDAHTPPYITIFSHYLKRHWYLSLKHLRSPLPAKIDYSHLHARLIQWASCPHDWGVLYRVPASSKQVHKYYHHGDEVPTASQPSSSAIEVKICIAYLVPYRVEPEKWLFDFFGRRLTIGITEDDFRQPPS